MGIDINRTKEFEEIQQQAIEEYFTYDAKIKNGEKIIEIIDKAFSNGNNTKNN